MTDSVATSSGRWAVVGHPLVPKELILESYQPGLPHKSDSPLRRLKEKGLATRGIEVRVRRPNGGLAGTISLYCSLNVDAARLQRRGDVKTAKALAKRATKIERSRSCTLLSRLFDTYRLTGSGWSAYLEALDHAPFRDLVSALAREVEQARAEVLDESSVTSVSALVSGFRGRLAYLVSENGEQLIVPRRQLTQENLDWIDAPVIITREEIGSNVIFQLKPGLAATDEGPIIDGALLTVGERTDTVVDAFRFAGLTFASPEASDAFTAGLPN